MTAKQVAEFLQTDRNDVYRLVKNEGLPCFKLSSMRIRFDKQDVRRWLRKRKLRNDYKKLREKFKDVLGD